MDSNAIIRSLDRVSARVGDPAPLVYARLFAARPDMEALFVRDTGGLVRGQMLMVVIESLLDFISDRSYAATLMQSERINHENLGVPPDVFDTFFAVLRDSVRDILDDEWTMEMEAAWSSLLEELAAPRLQAAGSGADTA